MRHAAPPSTSSRTAHDPARKKRPATTTGSQRRTALPTGLVLSPTRATETWAPRQNHHSDDSRRTREAITSTPATVCCGHGPTSRPAKRQLSGKTYPVLPAAHAPGTTPTDGWPPCRPAKRPRSRRRPGARVPEADLSSGPTHVHPSGGGPHPSCGWAALFVVQHFKTAGQLRHAANDQQHASLTTGAPQCWSNFVYLEPSSVLHLAGNRAFTRQLEGPRADLRRQQPLFRSGTRRI